MVDCLSVSLGSIVMDGSADADGIVWGWRDLPGWWEGGTPQSDVYGRLVADGSVFGRAYQRGRFVTVIGTATAIDSADPVSTLLVARRKLVEAVSLNADVDLAVDEGALGVLRAPVRQSRQLRFPANPSPRVLLFEVPVVSADWRKTDDTLTQTTVGGGGVVTNAGNAPATPSLRIAGDSDPGVGVINATTGQVILTSFDLGGGDVLVIDCATAIITLNGVDFGSGVELGSEFFDLAVGANTVNLMNGGAASLRVDYRTSWK